MLDERNVGYDAHSIFPELESPRIVLDTACLLGESRFEWVAGD